MTSTRKQAEGSIRWMFWLGLLIAIVGCALAVYMHPSTGATEGAGLLATSTDRTGDPTGYAVGLLLSGIGGAFLWVALTAWGVMLGVRAAGASAAVAEE